jgi:hypothetical protein
MSALEAKYRATLVFLVALLLLTALTVLRVSPWVALFPLFLAVFVYMGYAQEARRVLGEEAAKRLGLAFSPGPPSGEDLLGVPLFLAGEPKAYGEIRGEVLGRPFRRFEVQVYAARRFGTVGYRFTGVLYEVELPRPFPFLHLAPRGWATFPRERWPFLLAFLTLSVIVFVLLERYLAGLPVLKPGTSPLLLLAFPAFYLYLFAAWRVATRGIGPEVALEGELARRFRAWGSWSWGSIGEDTPLGQALLEVRKALGPFWLQVVGGKLYLAFLGELPTNPLLSPKAALMRWERRLRGEMGAIEGVLRTLGEPHPGVGAHNKKSP